MNTYRIISVTKSAAGVAVTVESDILNDVKEFLMSEECFKALPYREGEEITEEDVTVLGSEADFCKAYAAALRVLSYAPHSKSALIRKLVGKGFSKDVAERTASHAETVGTLDEDREASSIANYSARHKYWGKKRIAADLMQKGYARSAVNFALEEIGEEIYAKNLAKLLDKKPMPEDKAARDKYIAALCRMGYSLPEILRAVRDTK